jgi:hypothetical protein
VRCQKSANTATNHFMIISHKNTERHKSPRTVANQCPDPFLFVVIGWQYLGGYLRVEHIAPRL